jgi:hypothetical protein
MDLLAKSLEILISFIPRKAAIQLFLSFHNVAPPLPPGHSTG